MNNDWKASIGIVFDKSNVNSELEKVQKIAKETVIKILPQVETISMKNQFKSLYSEMASDLSKHFNIDVTAKDIKKTVTKIINDVNNAPSLALQKQNTKSNIDTFLAQNTKMTKELREQFVALKMSIDSVDDSKSLANIKTQLSTLKNEAKTTGQIGRNFVGELSNNFKKFANWMSVGTIFMSAIRTARQMTNSVIEIDSSMVGLKKVCNATDIQFERFLTNAIKNSKQLGTNISDLINATAEFSRLGYNLSDAEELGKVATLYQKVGDGISSTDASQSIISTMKAFGIQADEAISIIDKFNQIGNNFSISSAGIGEALQRSASSLAEANNDLSQSIALQVGANNVLQNPEKVGTMWNTVALRIRGAKTELQELGEDTTGMVTSTAKLRDMIKQMTGFDIMLDNSTFKSTYDIIVGIGKEYKKLDDLDQASLLEALAGKRQANALASAFNNIKDIEDAYKSAENSSGSAMKEFEKTQDGIQYSLDRFSASMQELALTTVNDDLVKDIVDLGTSIVELTNSIGGLVPILTVVGGLLLSKKLLLPVLIKDVSALAVAEGMASVSTTKEAIAEYGFSSAMALSTTAIKAKIVALKAMIATNPIAWITLFIGGLLALTAGIENATKKYVEAQKDLISKSDENIKKYDDEIDKLNSLSNKLSEAKGSKEKLNSIAGELNSTIGITNGLLNGEAQGWSVANQKIQDRISYLKELRKVELENKINAQRNVFNSTRMDNGNIFGGVDPNIKTLSKYRNLVTGYMKNNQDATVTEAWRSVIGNFGLSEFMSESDISKYFNKQTEVAQGIFKDYIDSSDGFFDTNILNTFVEKLVYGGYTLDEIKNELDNLSNNELGELINTYYESLSNKSADSEGLYNNISSQFDELIEKYPLMKTEFETLLNSLSKDIVIDNPVGSIFKDEVPSMFASSSDAVSTFESKIKTLKTAMDDTSSSNILDVMREFSDYDWSAYLSGEKSVDGALKELSNKTLSDAIKNSSELSDIFNDLFNNTFKSDSQKIKETSDEIENLTNVLDRVKNGQSLTKEEAEKLINIYPSLADKISVVSDGYSIEEDAIVSLVNSSISSYNTLVSKAEETTRRTIEETKKRIEAYKLETKARTDSTIWQADLRVRNATKGRYTSAAEIESYDSNWLKSILGDGLYADYLSANAEKFKVNSDYKQLSQAQNDLDELLKTPFKEAKAKSSKQSTSSSEFTGDIDNAKQSISILSSEVEKAQDVFDNATTYEKQISSINKLLKAQEQLRDGYKETVKTYKSEYNNSISGLSSGQISDIESGKSFDIKNFNGNKSLYDSLINAQTKYNDWQSALKSYRDTKNDISETITKQSDLIFQKAVDDFDAKIKQIDDTLNDVDTFSGFLNDNSIEQITLFQTGLDQSKNKASLLRQEISNLNKSYSDGTITQEQYKDRLSDLTSELYDAASSIKKYSDSIISAMKEKLNLDISDLEEQQKNITDALKDQLDSYKKIIDEKKKALRLTKETSDYEKDVAKKNKEIVKVQSRLLELEKAINSGDTSATKEYMEQQEKLAELKEELSEKQSNREIELSEDALDKSYEMFEENINKEIKSTNTEYENKINNIKTLYDTEKNLIIEAANLTNTEFTNAYNKIKDVMENNYITVSSNFKQAFSDTANSVSSSSSVSSILSSANKDKDSGGLSGLNKYLVQQGYGVINKAQMVQLAQALGLSDITSISDVGIDEKGKKNKNAILRLLKNAGFSSGGYVNAINSSSFIRSITGDDGIALVKHGEPILTVEQGEQFKKLITSLPKLNIIADSISTPSTNNGNINVEINGNLLTVEGNVDENVMIKLENFREQFGNEIVSKILSNIRLK